MKNVMDKQPYTCVLVSDFNLQNFTGYAAATDPEFPRLKPVAAPLGQPVPACWTQPRRIGKNAPDAAVVWTQPRQLFPL
jgi:hypothetical protein